MGKDWWPHAELDSKPWSSLNPSLEARSTARRKFLINLLFFDSSLTTLIPFS